MAKDDADKWKNWGKPKEEEGLKSGLTIGLILGGIVIFGVVFLLLQHLKTS